MRNASWYCVEIHQTKELEATVTTAMSVAKLTGFKDREPGHYAQQCNCASRLWEQRGNFSKALELCLESKGIREKIQRDVWSSYNNLGNLYLSMGDPALALKTHEECAALYENEASIPKHVLKMNRLNRGRISTFLGRFDEAHVLIDGAMELNDDWLMAIQ